MRIWLCALCVALLGGWWHANAMSVPALAALTEAAVDAQAPSHTQDHAHPASMGDSHAGCDDTSDDDAATGCGQAHLCCVAVAVPLPATPRLHNGLQRAAQRPVQPQLHPAHYTDRLFKPPKTNAAL